MSKTNQFVFQGLHIVAWIIFVGLCIEAGALLVNFVFALFKPEIVSRLYEKLNLNQLYQANVWAFTGMYSLIMAISALKAYLFYIVIKLMNKLDLTRPFNAFVSEQITQLSYYTLSIGLVGYIAREIARNLEHKGYDIDQLSKFWPDSQAFILMGGVIYVIALIFQKGIELQTENDLTV